MSQLAQQQQRFELSPNLFHFNQRKLDCDAHSGKTYTVSYDTHGFRVYCNGVAVKKSDFSYASLSLSSWSSSEYAVVDETLGYKMFMTLPKNNMQNKNFVKMLDYRKNSLVATSGVTTRSLARERANQEEAASGHRPDVSQKAAAGLPSQQSSYKLPSSFYSDSFTGASSSAPYATEAVYDSYARLKEKWAEEDRQNELARERRAEQLRAESAKFEEERRLRMLENERARQLREEEQMDADTVLALAESERQARKDQEKRNASDRATEAEELMIEQAIRASMLDEERDARARQQEQAEQRARRQRELEEELAKSYEMVHKSDASSESPKEEQKKSDSTSWGQWTTLGGLLGSGITSESKEEAKTEVDSGYKKGEAMDVENGVEDGVLGVFEVNGVTEPIGGVSEGGESIEPSAPPYPGDEETFGEKLTAEEEAQFREAMRQSLASNNTLNFEEEEKWEKLPADALKELQDEEFTYATPFRIEDSSSSSSSSSSSRGAGERDRLLLWRHKTIGDGTCGYWAISGDTGYPTARGKSQALRGRICDKLRERFEPSRLQPVSQSRIYDYVTDLDDTVRLILGTKEYDDGYLQCVDLRSTPSDLSSDVIKSPADLVAELYDTDLEIYIFKDNDPRTETLQLIRRYYCAARSARTTRILFRESSRHFDILDVVRQSPYAAGREAPL